MKKNIILVVVAVLIVIVYFVIQNIPYKLEVIDFEKYQEIVRTSGFVYIRDDNDICNETENIIKKLFKGHKYKVYKFVMDKNMSSQLYADMLNSTEHTKEGLTIPSIFYFKDGILVDTIDGQFSEDELLRFIYANEIIKK